MATFDRKEQASGGLSVQAEVTAGTGTSAVVMSNIFIGPSGMDAHRVIFVEITIDAEAYVVEVRMRDEAYEPLPSGLPQEARRGYLRRT